MADIEELVERLNSTKPDQPGWWMIERDDLGYRPAYLQLRDAALWSPNWRDGFRFGTKEEAEHHLELWHSEYGHVRSHGMMTEFVNPDGPEAATLLQAQQKQIEELREAAVALIIGAEQDSVADFPMGVDYGLLDNAWAAIDATYPAIWSAEQIAKIEAWQSCGWVHPLTCANRGDSWHKNEDGEEVLPAATPQGLVCRSCGYRQFKVPEVCFCELPPNPAEQFNGALNKMDSRP